VIEVRDEERRIPRERALIESKEYAAYVEERRHVTVVTYVNITVTYATVCQVCVCVSFIMDKGGCAKV